MRKQTYAILVDNISGVLSKIAGLFSRRGYSIDSITAGVSSNERYTRITVVATGDEMILAQIEKQVRKLEDVKEIKLLKDGESVFRELIIVKIRTDADQRTNLLTITEIFRAKVVDVDAESISIELTGDQAKIEGFLKIVADFEVLELVRTGVTGLSRGNDKIAFNIEQRLK